LVREKKPIKRNRKRTKEKKRRDISITFQHGVDRLMIDVDRMDLHVYV